MAFSAALLRVSQLALSAPGMENVTVQPLLDYNSHVSSIVGHPGKGWQGLSSSSIRRATYFGILDLLQVAVIPKGFSTSHLLPSPILKLERVGLEPAMF